MIYTDVAASVVGNINLEHHLEDVHNGAGVAPHNIAELCVDEAVCGSTASHSTGLDEIDWDLLVENIDLLDGIIGRGSVVDESAADNQVQRGMWAVSYSCTLPNGVSVLNR